MEKFAATKRAKVAADAKIAAEKAAAVAAEETAKKEKAAQRQADMTDELLEHFDVSGYICPHHWGKTLGCPVKFDVENACKNDYEKRLCFTTLFLPKVSFWLYRLDYRFGVRLSWVKEMKGHFKNVETIKNWDTTMRQKLYACEHTSGSLAFTTLGAPWKTVSVCRHCLTSTFSSATEEKDEQGRESASTV